MIEVLDSITGLVPAVVQPWMPSLFAFLFFTMIRYIYKRVVIRALRAIVQSRTFKNAAAKASALQNAEDVLDAFEKPINAILFIFGIYAAINVSPVANRINLDIVDKILRSLIIFNFVWGLYNACSASKGLLVHLLAKAGIEKDSPIINFVATLSHCLIVFLGFATMAREWNFDITGFIASLSIGSVAVAFAAKDALANVFGSFIIILDKPFKKGDLIQANGIEGTVEDISFRSTCLRTLAREKVYLPNSLLSNTPIVNFSNRSSRRIQFTLGLTYDSTAENMHLFIERLKEYLMGNPRLTNDEPLVHFSKYNDSSLDLQVICYADTNVYAEYMDIQNEINFKIKELLEETGLGCAFPSTSIYFENELHSTDKLPVGQPVQQKVVK